MRKALTRAEVLLLRSLLGVVTAAKGCSVTCVRFG